MKGISVSEEEARNVVKLYDDLDDFDKKPLSYKSIIRKPAKGRFCSRKREGHIGTPDEEMLFLLVHQQPYHLHAVAWLKPSASTCQNR